MTCAIAENRPLDELRTKQGLEQHCHSRRPDCVHGLPRPGSDESIFGAPGAVMGYCQALLKFDGTPELHTVRLREVLDTIGAPWSASHELYFGHCREQPIAKFLKEATRPLAGTGRVPILITGLDPAADLHTIKQIFESPINLADGETMLVRMVMKSDASVQAVAALMELVMENCRQTREMPHFWPLIQSESFDLWRCLKERLSDTWRFVNAAVNPFTPPEMIALLGDQITVAQLPIGLAEGMTDDGRIKLAPGMKIAGAPEEGSYLLPRFFDQLAMLETAPTLIFLGPTQDGWSEEMNAARIKRAVELTRQSIDRLWNRVPAERRELVWRLSA